jgi:DNA-binding HxlR family transcriptional regulator
MPGTEKKIEHNGAACKIAALTETRVVGREAVISIIKSSWKIIVLFTLNSEKDGMFYNDIHAKTGMTSRTLAAVLKSLVSEGVVERREYEGNGRVEYRITDAGSKIISSQCPLIS